MPSFDSHILNSFLLLTAVVLTYLNYSKIKILDPFRLVVLTLLFAIAVSIHGLSHLGLEYVYDFNPINNLMNHERQFT